MKPSIRALGEILYAPSQYVIPVFQRNYRWERPQWAKMWDSLNEIQRPEKKGSHFMGFLVFVPGVAQPGQHTTFHMIDGQQRLATLSIFLAAARNIAKQIGQAELADEIHSDYLTHPRKKGSQHYRLLPKERDHDSYVSIVEGKGQAGGRMADALAFFEEQLLGITVETPTRLRTIFDTVCQKLEFMCATLEAENAYNIFKSLNSTGVALGPSDLIRNFVFMHVSPDEQDEFDKESWSLLEDRFAHEEDRLDEERFSKFFRDYLMSSGRYVPPKDTFPTFESRYESTGFSPKGLALELDLASRHYAVISSETPDENYDVTQALAGLNLLESSTTYPLLLALFKKRAAGAIDALQLTRAIHMLRGFILRRFICGESSRGYGQMFVRALASDEGAAIAALEAYLLDRGWPDDDQFEAAFVEFPLYRRDYAREILETLERARGHKEPADLSGAQIEHVMPQTLNEAWRQALGPEAERIHAQWLDRPGNLTLSAYNQELWNHPFPTKRIRYGDSNIVVTREIAEAYDHWSEAEIRGRGHQLAREAAVAWVGPKKQRASFEPAADEDDHLHRSEVRRRFWTGFSDYLVAEFPDLPKFEIRPSSEIRLSSGIRHIGVEIRLSLRRAQVGIDIWYWREESMPVWLRIQAASDEFNRLAASTWRFEQIQERPRARMSIDCPVDGIRNEASWPDAYQWLGVKLQLVYDIILPKLRAEMDQATAAAEHHYQA